MDDQLPVASAVPTPPTTNPLTTKPAARSTGPWLWIGGTAALLLVGGLAMQLMKAQPGQAAGEPASGKQQSPAKQAVARVDREYVSYEALARECVERHGKEVLEDMVNRLVIQHACEEQGFAVTEEEVTQEINRIAKRFNLDQQAWYQMLQTERNITPNQYRSSVIWPMLALKKLAGEQVEVSEQQIQEAFVRNYGPRVKAKMIILDNQRRAQECYDKVSRDIDNFEKYAQEFSIDPTSRALGGSIPPIPRYSGNPELEKAAFRLKEGELSPVVHIKLDGNQAGRYCVLKCEGRTEPVVTDIAEVRETIYDELKEMETQKAIASTFDDLKKRTRIDNMLTGVSTGPDRPGANLGGGVQPASGSRPTAAGSAKVTPATAQQPVGERTRQ